MELAHDKIELIQTIVKNDRKFKENEDLYDDFVSETCKRSMRIIDSLGTDPALESYLKRVASTSIIMVLKDAGRLRRTKTGYMSQKEVSIDDKPTLLDYASTKVDYSCFSIPDGPEERAIRNEVLENIARCVKKIDSEKPDKMYLTIYTFRYDKGMTQKEISNELGISQSEVCKRLYKLMKKVKSYLE